MPPPRVQARRWRAVLLLLAVVVLGLLSRRFPLPGVFAEHTGDVLYTTAVFFVLRVLLPTRGAPTLAMFAFAISALVEATQLLRWQWLVDLRATTGGALFLGQGFQWADFAAYALGALFGVVLDAACRPRP